MFTIRKQNDFVCRESVFSYRPPSLTVKFAIAATVVVVTANCHCLSRYLYIISFSFDAVFRENRPIAAADGRRVHSELIFFSTPRLKHHRRHGPIRLPGRVRGYRGRGHAARGRQERLTGDRFRDRVTRTAGRSVPAERPDRTSHRGSDGQTAGTGAQ